MKVVKIGGNVIDDTGLLQDFLEKFAGLPGRKILVHGGGKIATRLAADMGIEAKMLDGRRVTDAKMLDVATMVYAGLTNKRIVASLQKHGCNALGLSGADGNVIKTVKRPVREVDYGFVGDVLAGSVDRASLKKLLEAGFIPVFSAITHDGAGQLLNTNADSIASALAVSLSDSYETSLIYCFEKDGVLADIKDERSVIKTINPDGFERLKAAGTIHEGMLPKLENAFAAIAKHVKQVHIGNAQHLHRYPHGEFGTCLSAI